MDFSPANITALVVAASFAAGLNIYATVLTLGILARTHWVALPPGLDSLGHTWFRLAGGTLLPWGSSPARFPDSAWFGKWLPRSFRFPVAPLLPFHGSWQL